ncbi:8407_t:CDS:2, partial [Scutellospora calospora]
MKEEVEEIMKGRIFMNNLNSIPKLSNTERLTIEFKESEGKQEYKESKKESNNLTSEFIEDKTIELKTDN